MNKSGSELVCRNIRNLEVADIVWENLVLGLIGETIDEDNNVCGCRIVHKATGKLNLKIEIWFQSRNAEVIDRIKVRMFDVISDGEPSKAFSRGGAPEFVYKVHGDP
jgi:translation initiation factor 4E